MLQLILHATKQKLGDWVGADNVTSAAKLVHSEASFARKKNFFRFMRHGDNNSDEEASDEN